jgi:hypothetical protein
MAGSHRGFDGKKKSWSLNGSSFYDDIQYVAHITQCFSDHLSTPCKRMKREDQ